MELKAEMSEARETIAELRQQLKEKVCWRRPVPCYPAIPHVRIRKFFSIGAHHQEHITTPPAQEAG